MNKKVGDLSKIFHIRTSKKKKVEWLCLAEWSYNNFLHSSIGMTPYIVVYGKDHPSLTHYLTQFISNVKVKDWAQERQEMLHELKGRLV